MKELELTLRVRNNRLKERREAIGMTQPELSAAARVSLISYRKLEALRCSPQTRDNGGCRRWREIALQLARFHCVEPEELFPPAVLGVKIPIVTRRIDAGDPSLLLGAYQQRLLAGHPDTACDQADLLKRVEELPRREAEILRLHYGLDDNEEHTFDQIGPKFGLSRSRVGQIEGRALRRLRRELADE